MATLNTEWLKTAMEVTGDFETEGNPWAGISNDFDQQGISCGILQWNIGQGSLQPLVNACGSAVVHAQMPARDLGQKAFDLASQWAADLRNSEEPSLREFCWFFDLVTQSSSMKGVWLDDVQSLIATQGRDKCDGYICDWMTSRPVEVQHRTDAQKNAALWRNKVPDEQLELFVLSYLRSLESKHVYQLVTMNRRGTIANARGWVNGELQDLKELREVQV